MGHYEPIRKEGEGEQGPAEAPSPRAGWQITDQYRVNQPHDRTARRLSQS